MDTRCWRSVDVAFTTAFVPDNLLGRFVLALVFWLEAVLPHALVNIGRYPMIIIRKE